MLQWGRRARGHSADQRPSAAAATRERSGAGAAAPRPPAYRRFLQLLHGALGAAAAAAASDPTASPSYGSIGSKDPSTSADGGSGRCRPLDPDGAKCSLELARQSQAKRRSEERTRPAPYHLERVSGQADSQKQALQQLAHPIDAVCPAGQAAPIDRTDHLPATQQVQTCASSWLDSCQQGEAAKPEEGFHCLSRHSTLTAGVLSKRKPTADGNIGTADGSTSSGPAAASLLAAAALALPAAGEITAPRRIQVLSAPQGGGGRQLANPFESCVAKPFEASQPAVLRVAATAARPAERPGLGQCVDPGGRDRSA